MSYRNMRRAAALCLLLVMLGVGLSTSGPSAAPTEQRVTRVARIIDGDTFVVAGGDRIRVRNFDTPELRRYGCAEEKKRAIAARKAAADILADRKVRLTLAYRDRYERWVADVVVESAPYSVDFVDAMIVRGHGARWNYGKEPKPRWCPA
ncbi:MAG: thermonuclease family protein [Neomegalonema sp.]|nr:thermonuclease family protein [Neomegalonema sp.]